MRLMKAMQVDAPGSDFRLAQIPVPEPGEDEVLLKILVCGISQGDKIIKDGQFSRLNYPLVPGHEVIGIIEKIGVNVTNWQIGQRVGVGWHGGRCFTCTACMHGDFWACENVAATGFRTNGGYAEYMIAHQNTLVSTPPELSPTEIIPIVCVAHDIFSALKNSGAKCRDVVAVYGLHGTGQLAVQYVAKLGFTTVVISEGCLDESLAYSLGADSYIDATAQNIENLLTKMGGTHVIFCTVPDGPMVSRLAKCLTHNGKIIIVNAKPGNAQIPSLTILAGRSVEDLIGNHFDEILHRSHRKNITSLVEMFPLEQVAAAYGKMLTSGIHFRPMLNMASDN